MSPMQRQTFGRLVAALRRQGLDPGTGQPWTQARLAAASGLSAKIIGDVERGRRVNLESDLLVRLADALGLTPEERYEFLMAASGLDHPTLRAGLAAPAAILDELLERLSQIQAPAYLHDPLGHVLAANRLMPALYGEAAALLRQIPCAPAFKFNLLRFVFEPRSPLRRAGEATWRRQACHVVQQWRAWSLRYRHTQGFAVLFGAIRTLPDFFPIWIACGQARTPALPVSPLYLYLHGRFGKLCHMWQTSRVLTPAGELYLAVWVPGNQPAQHAVYVLWEETGPGLIRYARWRGEKLGSKAAEQDNEGAIISG